MFSSDGNFLREIKLNIEPASLAFTESGDVIVCVPDGENKLSLFTEGGQFIKHINDKHLKTPFYISVGSDGRIITCDGVDKQMAVKSKSSPPTGMTCFSPSVLQIVILSRVALFITRTHSLFLISMLIVSRYSTMQECISMILAVRGLVTDS